MKILGISGSLRKGSYNTRLLELCRELLPERIAFEIYHCGGLPFYEQSLDGAKKPTAVIELLELVRNADALLFATPEYNYSIPGNLKNAIDWVSRPAYNSLLKDRPATIVSASMSGFGGLRAQQHLRQILGATLTPLYPAPDFLLPLAQNLFPEDGTIRDSTLEERLSAFLNGFISWAERQGSAA